MKILLASTFLVLVAVGCASQAGDAEETASTDADLTGATSWTVTASCNSSSADHGTCNLDTDGAQIKSVRLIGDEAQAPAACQESGNWGHDGSALWVAGGCSADFEVSLFQIPGFGGHGGHGDDHGGGGSDHGGPGGDHGGPGHHGGDHGDHGSGDWDTETVSCASWDNHYTTCGTSLDNIRQVRLARQESHSPCIEGRTFGSNGDSIWVNNGCRGQFEVSGFGHGHGGGDHGGGDHGGHGGGDHGGPGHNDDDAVVLYDQYGFNGTRFSVNTDIDNFANVGFNDRAQSMVINSGRWEVCEHAGFNGICQVFGPGSYTDLGALGHQASSIRRR